ncbi:MAG: NADH-quinone oxidoreductase subunit J [Bacteroidota bacterium]
MIAQFVFFLLAIVAVGAAFGMIVSRNPVSSALWLILNLLSIAGLYVTLNAEFIGIIQVLVYAGAIMVLFLFVIMLLNLGSLPRLEAVNWRTVIAAVVGVAVLAQLMYFLAASFDVLPEMVSSEEAAVTGTATAIGLELFTRYALALQIVGVLLLVATIGAVMLAKRRFL